LRIFEGEGEGGTPSCDPDFGAAEACGGSLTGTWTYETACLDRSPVEPPATCPEATSSVTSVDLSGTFSVVDNFWLNTIAGTIDSTMTIPATCLVGGVSCGVIGTVLAAAADSATCVSAGGGCMGSHVSIEVAT
jgi:hypothetical protein